MQAAIQPGDRDAGILLHPSSLPSGKLDDDAYRWLDWMATAGLSVWQVLPLGIPLTGLSPYQCASAFALNPALFPDEAHGQSHDADGKDTKAFSQWCADNQDWLDDFALFMALKQHFSGQEWTHWPEAYRQRDAEALSEFKQQKSAQLDTCIRQQFDFWSHWQAIRRYANSLGIRLFGDIPIFIAHDSADVWAHPDLFLLDEQGQTTFVTGVPPDYFSETGQRWGNPHYNWYDNKDGCYAWWQKRLAAHFDCFDLVRIDHFRGLEAAWMIPAECETAIEGHWQASPGDDLLAWISEVMGTLPLVAEDLGVITPEVTALRDKYQLPGMSVLQFGFDYFDDNPHKPHNVTENRVYYTGTHDNDTLLGWFNSLTDEERDRVHELLNSQPDDDITDKMLETILASPSGLVMMTLQDLLRLDTEARMNTPGTIVDNWEWRFDWSQLPADLAQQVHSLLHTHQRLKEQG